MNRSHALACLFIVFLLGLTAHGRSAGMIQGAVTLQHSGQPVHRATVMLVQLGFVTETDEEGRYILENVPPGSYDIVAYTPSVTSPVHWIEVTGGETKTVDLQLRISPIRHEITVTAKGRQETAFEAVQSVTSMDSFEISEQMAPSIGEVLDQKLGLAKRSSGPGSARPMIRGFDGDRVLVMQDGIRVGSLGSQAGDHGEPIDPASIDRLEVVRGPATLLYGSNAVGGVVNAVTSHQEYHQQPHEGIRGQITSSAGTNNSQAGASVNLVYGTGNWLFSAGGGGQRTGDYKSPLGKVDNSKARISNGTGGLGWYGGKGFASLGYTFNDGRYGIPFAEGEEEGGLEEEQQKAVDSDFRRQNVRFSGGFHGIQSFIDAFRLTGSFTDWRQDELEILENSEEVIGTRADNEQFIYRGVFEQRVYKTLSGSLGFWDMNRRYEATGEEVLSPPTDQEAFAVFALEELDFERVKVQLGGRVEYTHYTPGSPAAREPEREGAQAELQGLPERNFTGFSGGVGARVKLWKEGAFVTNYTSSYRAPALEELYNFGPHLGLRAFEVGNPDLKRERSNGLDFSLRHLGERVRGEANLFYYDIDDFVFLAPTGESRDGLFEAEYQQGASQFLGTEVGVNFALHDSLWLDLGLEWVRAQLTASDTPLPRIPPLRGRVGLDFLYKGLSVGPEVVMASSQKEIFTTETPTPGYTVINLIASYTMPRQHFAHHFSVNVFNVGDRLYRNHVSFIKDFAPEMGRGLRFSYVMKFF